MQDIAFDATPDAGKPPLLLVHGFLVSRNVWARNLALSEHFRVIRIDLPGHGHSPAPDSLEGYKPRAIAKAIEDLRVSLGITRWHLCGQSLGANVVLWYAHDYPGQTGAVVFTNANMAIREEGEYSVEEFARRADRVRDPNGAGAREEKFHPAFGTRVPEPLRNILSHDADQIPREVAANYLECSLTQPLASRLQAIRPPLMLVNGLLERSFQDLRQRFEREVPAAEVADLNGGHAINLECADEFNALTIDFLHRHGAGMAASQATADGAAAAKAAHDARDGRAAWI